MTPIALALAEVGLPFREYGLTALDRYLGARAAGAPDFYLVQASVVDLARSFEELSFPGLSYADAGLDAVGGAARFLCVDAIDQPGIGALPLTDFRRDPTTGIYYDPAGVYPALRKGSFESGPGAGENSFFETALYLSRLEPADGLPAPGRAAPARPSALWQKDLLSLVLQGRNPVRSLEFLRETGFVEATWPVLAGLLTVDHSKDCHPEGGGWTHTLEALGHRKSASLSLSLAILLHDVGKPRSAAVEGRRFDRHAEIGATLAADFLASLGFGPRVVEDVRFLVRWHMLPAALPRLPVSKVQDVVFDPRFPELLELYRCDEFSSFKGPGAYYEACAAYRAISRNRRNPYRDADGRKRSQAFLSVRS